MKNKFEIIGAIVFWILLIYATNFWYPSHEIKLHLEEGWIAPTSWNCPVGHPIKANLKSMIYHLPGDPYYTRTDALNGECFDTAEHAVEQGFRGIY